MNWTGSFFVHCDGDSKEYFLSNVREFSLTELVGILQNRNGVIPLNSLPKFLTIGGLTYGLAWAREESDERGMYLATAWIHK